MTKYAFASVDIEYIIRSHPLGEGGEVGEEKWPLSSKNNFLDPTQSSYFQVILQTFLHLWRSCTHGYCFLSISPQTLDFINF